MAGIAPDERATLLHLIGLQQSLLRQVWLFRGYGDGPARQPAVGKIVTLANRLLEVFHNEGPSGEPWSDTYIRRSVHALIKRLQED